ncbi:hypothetical protein JHK87_055523 [Glycine soja]|nr:hypothetical protein JHK87_055523 [Glycine soja]
MPRNQLESLLCMLSIGSTPNLVYRNNDDNIIVLSNGHWFLHHAVYYEGGSVLGCHYCPGRNHTKIGFYDVLRKALRITLNSIIDKRRGKGYGIDSRTGTRGACANSNMNLNRHLSEEDRQVFQA